MAGPSSKGSKRGKGVFVANFARRAVPLGLTAFVLVCSVLSSRPKAVETETALGPRGDARIEFAQSEARERRKRSREQRRNDQKSGSRSKTLEPRKEKQEEVPAAKTSDPKAAGTKSPAAPAPPSKIPAPLVEPPAEKLNTWTDQEIIAALQACVRALGPAVVEIEPATAVRSGQCGAAAPVMLRRIGPAPGVEIRPPAMLNCAMVAGLHEWVEGVVQPFAREVLGAPVAALTNLSGYDCRFRNNAPLGKLSEHAHANALDVGGFVTANKRKLDVLANWGPTARDLEARAAEAAKVEGKQAEEVAAGDKAERPVEGKSGRTAARRGGRGAAAGDGVSEGEPSSKRSEPAAVERTGRTRGNNKRRAGTEEDEGSSDTPQSADVADEPRRDGKKRRERGRPGEPRSSDGRPLEPADTAPAKTSRRRGREQRQALPIPAALSSSAPSPPATPESLFLKRIHQGACGIFTTVLGPEANEAHRNHFHLDLAPRRRESAFCE